MCGLAGVFGGSREAAATPVARRMSEALAHRGPDDVGLFDLSGPGSAPGGTFAHRRLSILDLSPCGHQPMTARAGRFTIVFNGEIYNYNELRAELSRRGRAFASDSDTEVILEGWASEGETFLRRLRGMFSLAIWDDRAGRGYLARDAFGIKPLYVASVAGQVLFASELRAILATGLVPRHLSRAAMLGFLSQGAVPEPLTAIEGVEALPPGTVSTVSIEEGRAVLGPPRSFARSLEPAAVPLEDDPVTAARLVGTALRESVRLHLVSDVPVALFLSGGIDSSAVVALASEQTAEPLQTFTITFGEKEFSEAGAAASVAKRFATEHHEVPLSGADLLRSLPAALDAMDQPSLDGLNTYAVSAAVRRAGFKVVLSGLGGDELFAGYPSFARARRLARAWSALGPLRPLVERAAGPLARRARTRGAKLGMCIGGDDPASAAYRASRALFAGQSLVDLLGEASAAGSAPAAAPPPGGLSLLQRVSWYELTGYMRSTLLRDSDVFSMAHGLELRVPFVDAGVAAASMAVADSVKLDPAIPKRLIVDAVGDVLPREVWDRPKRGFELPFARWMRHELRAEVNDVLTSSVRVSRVGLRPDVVRAIWKDFLDQRGGITWSRPWALFCLVRWAETVGATISTHTSHAAPAADDADGAERVDAA